MKKQRKQFLISLGILLGISIFISGTIQTIPERGSIADFYGGSREVTLEELIEEAQNSNQSLYLPLDLPSNLKMTAIYLRYGAFLTIIVYSANGNKDYKTAELTIQVSISFDIPTYESLQEMAANSDYESAIQINSWNVYINEKANSGSNEEFKAIYGDFTLLATSWIDGCTYTMNCPTITKNQVSDLIESMEIMH